MSRTWAPLLLLVLFGCGGFSEASNSDASTASDGGGFGSDMSEFTNDFSIACATEITVDPTTAVAPATFIAEAQYSGSAVPTWIVTGPNGQITPAKIEPSNLQISVSAPVPGTYSFQLVFEDGAACSGFTTATAVAPGAETEVYRVRLTPPAETGVPQQDQPLTVVGGTPSTASSFGLVNGAMLAGSLRGPSGGIAGQVSLLPQSGPPVLAITGANGQFAVSYTLDGTYTLLLLPTDSTLAPHVVGPVAGTALATTALQVGTGVVVSGLVRNPSLQPIVGATVALHTGMLPSSLGTSLGSGAYSVQMEPGTVSLTASASGWPDLTCAGLAVGATGATLGVDESVTRLATTLKVVAADGSTPVAGAHVTLRSSVLANAGVVHASDGDHAATGVVNLAVVTAADGTVSAQLPAADYDVLLEPAQGGTNSATGLHVTIASAGTVSLAFAASVTFTGSIVSKLGAAVANARVRAAPVAGAAVVTTTDAHGKFTLAGLGKGLSLALDVSPPISANLVGASASVGDPTHLGGALPASTTIALGAGIAIGGVVYVGGNNSQGIGGVVVDVLCANCDDPTPIAHTESSGSGQYQLYLPDPGLSLVDGGVPDL